ncbi:hypothetical protein Rs2_16014 [Raphanus sativus]|nr:hypothetical protein Rs2_16014 [Raphanus sativus]
MSRFPMQSKWRVSGSLSGENPSSVVAGEPPPIPLQPPDPPDPTSPLSPQEFPTLSEAKSTPKPLPNYRFDTVSRSKTVPSVASKGTKQKTAAGLKTLASATIVPSATEEADTTPMLTDSEGDSVKNTIQEPGSTAPPSLVERIRLSENKTLQRLAPVTIAPNGRPRVLIPDIVFQRGAEIHKDFIICYFNGRSPPFHQIQSVFNYMWGKGKRLEIHNNLLNRSVIVCIQSDYLRQKILEKNIWYVGDSMFHTAQWSSAHSKSTPPLKAIQIWAHLTAVPLDLRHDQGMSLVAGLIGEPKEMDEFTKNLVSLTLSHVKVEVDLTKQLPSIVELEREDGEVVEVSVHYPWVPPTCSHCH